MISIQNKVIIGATKDDIKYMVQELKNIRKHESDKDLKNKSMEGVNPNSVGYCVWFKDFKPYRSMVDTLIKTIDNLNRMCNHNSYQEHSEFMNDIFRRLNYEAGELHKLKEDCKGDYNQYRCLSDAYIRLTDKIYKLELDKPSFAQEIKVKKEDLKNVSEYIINKISDNINTTKHKWDSSGTVLFDYQQDVVDFKGKNLICDWSRSAGKTFTIIKIIELNKPKNVLFVTSGNDEENMYLDQLYKKLYDDNQIFNENKVNIYTLSNINGIDLDIVFDYVFFEEILPYNIGVKFKQSICFISYNDKDEWLERFYPNCKISKIDYKPLVESGVLKQKMIDECSRVNHKNYLNEFAILD